MTEPKYITLKVANLENIIINAVNQVYGSHIGYITTKLKDALIENAVDSETFITYSVKQNPLYKQMMDWVHGKGDFEKPIARDLSKYSDDLELNETIKLSLESSARINELHSNMMGIQEDATQFLEHDARTQFLNK